MMPRPSTATRESVVVATVSQAVANPRMYFLTAGDNHAKVVIELSVKSTVAWLVPGRPFLSVAMSSRLGGPP